MDQCLIGIHFERLQADACVYVFKDGTVIIIVAVYVDDLLLFSNSLSVLIIFKQKLAKKFAMKDLGEAHFILGIQIERNRATRTLCYLKELMLRKC